MKIIFKFFFLSILFNSNCLAESNLRVVSLAPIITEIIIDLGLENSIVGKTKYCVTREKTDVSIVGSSLDPSIETIVGLNPDYVMLMSGQEALRSQIEKFRIKVIYVKNSSIEEIDKGILEIAQAFNEKERAQKIISENKVNIQNILNQCRNDNLKSLFVFDEGDFGSRKVFYAASKSSIYSEIMEKVGLVNLLQTEQEYSELTLEGIKTLNPEKLFLVTESKNSLAYLNTIIKLTGIKSENIVLLPKEPTLFPGPRYPKIIELFACHRSRK